jgi:hypothetical protein
MAGRVMTPELYLALALAWLALAYMARVDERARRM